jgi:gluconate 2-dehydrogenase gamma chain
MSVEETIKSYLTRRINRREFIRQLRTIGVTAGTAFACAELLGATGCQLEPALRSQQAGTQSPVALTQSEFRAVEAIAARIFPTTDTPGAVEAGAANYVDQALADAYSPHLNRYRRALGQLEGFCDSKYQRSFTALTSAQQDALLKELEGGKIPQVEDGSEFFRLLRRHVLEGVFCEPYYGGNRDLIGWRLVGFPGQRYGYPDPYINRVVDLPPVAVNGPPRKGT